MKRVFQNKKTGDLIYFENDKSPEYKKFEKKEKKEYKEWFEMQGK